jgi:hypothetical protein
MPYPNRNQRPRETPSKAKGALNLFFNPSFGTSFSTIKDTGRMFVHLIAMIFSQANLIDKRHPAVIDPASKFGLFSIINLAYQRVEWRQENIGQIAIFLGVCSCLAVCAIGLVYGIFTALLGMA